MSVALYDEHMAIKFYAVAEPVDARRSIRQNVVRFDGEASVIEVIAAAAFASVGHRVAHARLVVLRLAKGQTGAVAALTLLQTLGAVRLRS